VPPREDRCTCRRRLRRDYDPACKKTNSPGLAGRMVRFFTELGGLLSYGNDPLDNFHRAATYADRILKGTKPSELPVQATIKFEWSTSRPRGYSVSQCHRPWSRAPTM
jgi:hypothetical protein